MEAWKFLDYSSFSPVFALGFTTERWGLERFPPNLVAISGYWKNIKGSNNTVESWTLPYQCSSESSPNYDYHYLYDGYYSNNQGSTNVSASANICTEPQPCPDSGCIILIEGIGKTTIGPANSGIIGLSHAISFILVIIITTTIIMGCDFSKLIPPEEPPPRPSRPAPEHLRQYLNPPQRQEQTYAGQAVTPANMAREVARCSALLRQMYALDLQIWGMEGCIPEEVPRREEMKRRANALFAEIRRMITGWRSSPDAGWSAEERQQIEEICRVVDQHDARRY
ncbi:hypothetical protein FGG08_005908 [Glutinoglossum americanum]|uniref:Uncharacterized protein n=1 Tax=Glutinoglossum americanum TaxID=1670608 RepID=A0A9P8KY13_9PEZI|nr:hypothetical protein FGG08_005908 [Glutinoglossum americanum]